MVREDEVRQGQVPSTSAPLRITEDDVRGTQYRRDPIQATVSQEKQMTARQRRRIIW